MTGLGYNRRAAVRGYLEDFERRFVQTADGVVYLPGETGQGVRVPQRDAAGIIAGMRATLEEVEARRTLRGADAFFAAGFVLCFVMIFGAISGFTRIAAGLMVPLTIAFVVLGPLLGALRIHLAWRSALAEADRRMATFERIDIADTRRIVRPNPMRAVFLVALLFCGAIIAGLMLASATSPTYVAAAIDRFLSGIIGWMIGALVLLGFAYKAIDAHVRRRVSEADIGIAADLRRRRPLVGPEWEP